MNYQQHLANSAAIRAEIQRFESVHPNIYSIYELLEQVDEPQLQNQIREHVIAIEGRAPGGGGTGLWVGVHRGSTDPPVRGGSDQSGRCTTQGHCCCDISRCLKMTSFDQRAAKPSRPRRPCRDPETGARRATKATFLPGSGPPHLQLVLLFALPGFATNIVLISLDGTEAKLRFVLRRWEQSAELPSCVHTVEGHNADTNIPSEHVEAPPLELASQDSDPPWNKKAPPVGDHLQDDRSSLYLLSAHDPGSFQDGREDPEGSQPFGSYLPFLVGLREAKVTRSLRSKR